MIGNSFVSAGEYERALTTIEQAISSLAPNTTSFIGLADAYYLLGLSYDRVGGVQNSEQAILNYSKTIESDPEYTLAYVNRGTIYYFQDKYELAIADFDKAITLTDDEFLLRSVYNNRGNLYSNQGIEELAQADFIKAIEIDPSLINEFSLQK